MVSTNVPGGKISAFSLNCNLLSNIKEEKFVFPLGCPMTAGHRATQEKMDNNWAEKNIYICSIRKIGFLK